MTQLSQSEENYLKTIFHVYSDTGIDVATNEIAENLSTSPASVSDMLKKLSVKKLVHYEKYKGVTLTEIGNTLATKIVRKHRLWEVFLVQKLHFSWDEVHEIAEELEHIQSSLLIQRLDDYLGNPTHDPHGDPIPNEFGQFNHKVKIILTDFDIQKEAIVMGVKDTDSKLLKYLDKVGITLGTKIKILEIMEFDSSMEIEINENQKLFLSKEISKNIFVN